MVESLIVHDKLLEQRTYFQNSFPFEELFLYLLEKLRVIGICQRKGESFHEDAFGRCLFTFHGLFPY